MALTAYLKIPDIPGESQRADHEEEIDVHGVAWGAAQASSAQIGSGRTRARASVSDLTVMKIYDASSPYLALACMQGKSFDEIVLMVRKDSGEAHLDYLTITMTNVVVSSYNMSGGGLDPQANLIEESVSFSCENIKVLYTMQAEDHSAGDEHEIEYDIAAGV